MAKDVVKHYRLTTDDAAAFRKKAEEAGMTESDYFRLLITQQPSDYPEIRGGIKVLINEVNRIGVNINEIVFNNNSNLSLGNTVLLLVTLRSCRLNPSIAFVV